MNNNDQTKKYLYPVLIVLCVAMTAANIFLLHSNKELRAKTRTVAEVPVGKSVKSISGMDFLNTPVSITTRSRSTVLMLYSPTCPYCEKNWPSWSSVISHLQDRNVTLATVDLTASATPEFIAAKKTGRALAIKKLDPADFVALDLNLTPQTILIGGDSKVQKVWTGVLKPSDLETLLKLAD